eukprot:CAMPEP_0183297968 /NCGR_PEP_ID=MMETSP0160_2-20130417/5108_1 /TAXON_ID=2839 ORGANISM="Odontella Sinensis, Strain Grunow 1884" /NCGR_SAMPLE_ID=MMETSP0160_2 /ASSEMBLY_ACC=CAM_ASM_000250 /LENGTH=530 /DNA_ID=CAMNT_0025459881 /DNA_START=177 /DNA_END=1769 /DNA_ORIENTATION=-
MRGELRRRQSHHTYSFRKIERSETHAAELSLPSQGAPCYCRPQQRQKWDEPQEHPHVNWGDLFFDLFYVAAAYNLGTLLKESKYAGESILYFVGTFGPVYLFWFEKMNYDARFSVAEDSFHSAFEVFQLAFLATAVLHIRPAELLSNPYENAEMFAFSLAMFLGAVGTTIRYIEVALFVVGEPAAKATAKKELQEVMIPLACFLAATIVSGSAYMNNEKDDVEEKITHLPIILCLTGWLAYMLCFYARLALVRVDDEKFEEIAIPMNGDFVLHRYGEWTMLMLGESVLSLLTVDVSEGEKYYVTFYAGILSVTALQYLHFRSQPYHAEDHALARGKNSGAVFAIVMQIYSAGLIVLGASYKMLLYEYIESSGYDDKIRWLGSTSNGFQEISRGLAGTDKQQKVANMFCFSMAIVFLCLDIMLLAHHGLKESIERCDSGLKWFLTLVRLSVVVFIATLSQYFIDPEFLAVIGWACVMVQVLVRLSGCRVFEDTHNEHNEHESHNISITHYEDTHTDENINGRMKIMNVEPV